MPAFDVEARSEVWPLKEAFTISRGSKTAAHVVVAMVRDGAFEGRGEAVPYARYGETVAGVLEQIRSAAPLVSTRSELAILLKPGAALNALDCALWDLEAQTGGPSARQAAGIHELRPLMTTLTLSADDPEKVAQAARDFTRARALKLKLTGDGYDASRVLAVRSARPDVWLSVDANQAFDGQGLLRLLPALLGSDVRLIEQPLPAGRDAALRELKVPIPLAADESAQCATDIPSLVGLYDIVNIKLDKCGGLTEALEMARLARRFGLDLMVGNMCGTSLAMAPAYVLGQLCDVVDLDGPMLLASDREPSLTYRDGMIDGGEKIWGAPRCRERLS